MHSSTVDIPVTYTDDASDITLQDPEKKKTLRSELVFSTRALRSDRQCPISASKAIILIVSTILLGLFGWLVTAPLREVARSPRQSALYTDCGKDHLMAAAAGCVFDPMAVGWMAPECRNPSLFEEYALKLVSDQSSIEKYITNPAENIWFRWPNLTEPISDPSEMIKLDEIWSYGAFHVWHCLYMAQLAVLAAMRVSSGEHNVLLNSRSTESEHVEHCFSFATDIILHPSTTQQSLFTMPGTSVWNCNVLSPR
ncbi:hypothetical protein KJE20_14056 [Pyrenophora tritici-repentis]|nr:hypothetical protein KJE20_14056 [Pyrenophora tritici-repentis]